MTQRAPAAAAATVILAVVAGCSATTGSPAPAPGVPVASNPGASAVAAPPGSVPPGSAPGSAPAGDHAGAWDVSTMPDPCLTIDSARVLKAIGVRVTAGVPLDSWPPLCSFTFVDAQEYLYVFADPRPEARVDYDRQRSDSQATEAVRGIGDDAYWLPEFTALHVFEDATHLMVKFAGSVPPADPKGKALALARAVLG